MTNVYVKALRLGEEMMDKIDILLKKNICPRDRRILQEIWNRVYDGYIRLNDIDRVYFIEEHYTNQQ